MSTQPAVRWVPSGENAGIYLWVPALRRWRYTKLVAGGVEDRTVDTLPFGSTPLVALSDVGEAIDMYRDDLFAGTDARVSRSMHETSKAIVLNEVSDAADLALYEPDPAGGQG